MVIYDNYYFIVFDLTTEIYYAEPIGFVNMW